MCMKVLAYEITRLRYGLYILRILKFALNFIVLQSQLTIRFSQVTESNLLRFLGYERHFFEGKCKIIHCSSVFPVKLLKNGFV